jgi:nucleoredoxin
MQNIIKTDTLVNNEFQSVSLDKSLKNIKVVGLYYSASYCPPCHKFTPLLAKVYEELKDLGLEIILIPSDKTQEAYEDYYKTHPWLSLPYDNDQERIGNGSNVSNSIRSEWNVKIIPTLIFFTPAGDMLCREGRLLVQNQTLDEIIAKLGL